jgi:hypothetical protein
LGVYIFSFFRFDFRFSMLVIRCSMFVVRCSEFDTRDSIHETENRKPEHRTSNHKHRKTNIYFLPDLVLTTLYGTQIFGLQHDIITNSAGQQPPAGQVPSKVVKVYFPGVETV